MLLSFDLRKSNKSLIKGFTSLIYWFFGGARLLKW